MPAAPAVPSPDRESLVPRLLLFALLCSAAPTLAAGPGDDAGAPPGPLPIVRTLAPDGPVPARTLSVEDRDEWVVVTLRVEPAAEPDAPEAPEEDGGAFGDSAADGSDEEIARSPEVEEETARSPEAEAALAELAGGGLEWAVVLCEVDPGVAPEVSADADRGGVSVRYGLYFVREDGHEDGRRLRVYRQPKPVPADGEPAAWALREAPAESDWAGPRTSAAVRLVPIKRDGWFWTVSQPMPAAGEELLDAPADVVVRVAEEDDAGAYGVDGYGRAAVFGTEIFSDGGWTVADEGDLLTARRTPFFMPAQRLIWREEAAAAEARREARVGTDAPPLDAGLLTAAGEPAADGGRIDLASLRGDVVLLDFWGTWCGPCVRKLPAVAELHETYADRGLRVIGVHSPSGADELPEFLEDNPVPFPLALATREATEAYEIAFWPTYFLIGRDGTLVRPPGSAVPTAEEIEAALAAGAEPDAEGDEPADD